MAKSKGKYRCLYCGEPTKRGRKGEHIVAEAIGGALTLNNFPKRAVCQRCNSGVLSRLDKELCSRSYLSVIASREIGAHLWQAWDVDHGSNNALVEARPVWCEEWLSSLVCYPQIIFERTGPELRGDSEEFLRFGQEDARKVLFEAVRRCFGRYRAGEKGALNFERVRSSAIYKGYQLPPRIFAPRPIGHVAQNSRKQSFILRFVSEEDKRFALNSLEKLNDGRQFKKWTDKLGSRYPAFCFFFDVGDTLRALMKTGINLIAAYCSNTPVSRENFPQAVDVILRDDRQIPRQLLMSNGFVHAEDVESISAEENAHSFRLTHMDGMWEVYFAFFGGKVGAYVRLPGPNREEWRCADIVAPLGSKDWTINTSNILLPMKTPRVVWEDGSLIAPSVKIQNTVSELSVEVVRRKRTRK